MLMDLAKLRWVQGDLPEAEALFQRAVAIRERAFGLDHILTAAPRRGLASVLQQQGRQAEAEPLLRQSQATIGHWMSPVFAAFNAGLSEFAGVEADLTAHDCAQLETGVRRSLMLTERLVGPEHPTVATILDRYAAILRKQGRTSEAEQMEGRARRIREEHQQG